MSAEVYKRLLGEFQQGWHESAHTLCNVEIRSPACLTAGTMAHPDTRTVNYETEQVIAGVSLPAKAGSEILIEALALVKREQWPSQELIDKFVLLCREAGAALPLMITNRLDPYHLWLHRAPESWWIELLASLHGFTAYDAVVGYQDQHFFTHPWKDSADAIEYLRLNTDSPSWPDNELVGAEHAPTANMSWQDAAERMERLRQQGEPFSSQHKLARQIGCSSATISKAIRRRQSLKAWANVEGVPKAQSINDVVTDSTAQDRELGPEDEAAIREFVESADAEAKAWFLAMPTAEQLAYLNDPDSHKGTLHKRILSRKP
jgi:hypothetical protein